MAGGKRQPSSSPCSVEVSVALTTTLHAHQARCMTPTTSFSSPKYTNVHTHTHSVHTPPCKGLSSQVLSLLKPSENLITRALCGNLSAVHSAELFSQIALHNNPLRRGHIPHMLTLSPHFKQDDARQMENATHRCRHTHTDNMALWNFV